jgi:hypothetical protein
MNGCTLSVTEDGGNLSEKLITRRRRPSVSANRRLLMPVKRQRRRKYPAGST